MDEAGPHGEPDYESHVIAARYERRLPADSSGKSRSHAVARRRTRWACATRGAWSAPALPRWCRGSAEAVHHPHPLSAALRAGSSRPASAVAPDGVKHCRRCPPTSGKAAGSDDQSNRSSVPAGGCCVSGSTMVAPRLHARQRKTCRPLGRMVSLVGSADRRRQGYRRLQRPAPDANRPGPQAIENRRQQLPELIDGQGARGKNLLTDLFRVFMTTKRN